MSSKAQAPRRHTPDHPPYAVMIGEAIRSLAEQGGSTEAAISQYIKSNHDDLPWGHDRLLPYYLKKLTIFRELTVGGPGRYLVVEDPTVEPALASKETVLEGDVDEPLKSLPPPMEAHLGDKSLPGFELELSAHEGNAGGQSQSIATLREPEAIAVTDDGGVLSPVPKRRCRRPRRKLNSGEIKEVEAKDDQGTSRPIPSKAATIESGGDGSLLSIPPSEPKNIEGDAGGPPECLATSSIKAPDAGFSDLSFHKGNVEEQFRSSTSKDGQDCALPVPRRRGRPPKRKTTATKIKFLCRDALLQRMPAATMETGRDGSLLSSLPSDAIDFEGYVIEPSKFLAPSSNKDCDAEKSLQPSPTNAKKANEVMSFILSKPLAQEGSVKEPLESLATNDGGLASSSVYKRRIQRPKRKSSSVSAPLTNVDPLPQANAASIENAGNGSLSSILPSKPMNSEGNLAEPSTILLHSQAFDEEDSMSLALADPSSHKDDVGEPFQSLTTKDSATSSLLATKRRGRPPKRKRNRACGWEVRLNSKQVAEDLTETKSGQGVLMPTASSGERSSSKPAVDVAVKSPRNAGQYDGSSSQPTGDQGGAVREMEYVPKHCGRSKSKPDLIGSAETEKAPDEPKPLPALPTKDNMPNSRGRPRKQK